MITSTQRSARTSRPVRLLLTVLAGYLVGRGILEPFVIDMGDPATYRHDWGGRPCSAFSLSTARPPC